MSAESASEHEAPSGEPGGASAPVARCARHAESVAIGPCEGCGDFLCGRCVAQRWQDTIACAGCVSRARALWIPPYEQPGVHWGRGFLGTVAALCAGDRQRLARLAPGRVRPALEVAVAAWTVFLGAFAVSLPGTAAQRAAWALGAGIAVASFTALLGVSHHVSARSSGGVGSARHAVRAVLYAQAFVAALGPLVAGIMRLADIEEPLAWIFSMCAGQSLTAFILAKASGVRAHGLSPARAELAAAIPTFGAAALGFAALGWWMLRAQ